jgi:hypothetical protein
MRTVFSWRNEQADDMKKDINEIGYGSIRWMELAQNRVQWWALVLPVLNVRVLLAAT